MADPRQRPVCAEQHVVVVGLRATTSDAFQGTGAVLLACCWRCQHVVVAVHFYTDLVVATEP